MSHQRRLLIAPPRAVVITRVILYEEGQLPFFPDHVCDDLESLRPTPQAWRTPIRH